MKTSAGILLYRIRKNVPEVLLVHPGGPYFKQKDTGVWSVPKGEFSAPEEGKDAAIREFKEELGVDLKGEMLELSPVIQKGGKKVFAWAIEGDLDEGQIICNTFFIEWPPRSGKMQEFPEVDKASWLDTSTARLKIIPAQVAFIDELEAKLFSHRVSRK